MMNICELPEDCLAQILSQTTPGDVIRSSAVSKHFLSVSKSDIVWDKFVPSDCVDIISQSSSLIRDVQFDSKKDLFLHLSHHPILLENSTKSFALDKWSGKICYMLGARALSVIWGSSPEYWTWAFVPGSRFPECAKLNYVCWLDIKGKIHATLLSQATNYGAYFVFKIESEPTSTSGFEQPVEISLSKISEDGLPIEDNHVHEIKQVYLKAPSRDDYGWREQITPELLPRIRGDGWMEIEMGRCQIGVEGEGKRLVLELILKEIENLHWKSGLVVYGIELRPLS